jgi:hypothetical protein
VLTDIASGWTECVAMPVRNQSLTVEAMTKVASDLPFPMLGVDTDNDSAFMNQTVFDHCKKNGLEQKRAHTRLQEKRPGLGRTEERIYCQAFSGLCRLSGLGRQHKQALEHLRGKRDAREAVAAAHAGCRSLHEQFIQGLATRRSSSDPPQATRCNALVENPPGSI